MGVAEGWEEDLEEGRQWGVEEVAVVVVVAGMTWAATLHLLLRELQNWPMPL